MSAGRMRWAGTWWNGWGRFGTVWCRTGLHETSKYGVGLKQFVERMSLCAMDMSLIDVGFVLR